MRERSLKKESRTYDFVVAGGGLAGMAAAIMSARRGIKVALINDRPVLGGVASVEFQGDPVGAFGGYNNFYFRETGIVEEWTLEQFFSNPEGNWEIWNTILLSSILKVPNIDLYLNTTITKADCKENRITDIVGITIGEEKEINFSAPLFCDATGDGTLAYLSGAEYRMGKEAKNEFNESLAPIKSTKNTMGHSVLFSAKDVGREVRFIPLDWAHKFNTEDFHGRELEIHPLMRGYWWIEIGGKQNTIYDSEEIRMELMRIVYGVWDYLKNHPSQKENHKTLDLEFVSTVAGRREARRIVGDYVLTQNDIVTNKVFNDSIAYGGWPIDDHYSKGFFYKGKKINRSLYLPGLYNIPLRCLYSKNIKNLFLSGRLISVSHMALASTRVMFTCVQTGEAVGLAASVCLNKSILPKDIVSSISLLKRLQQYLLKDDHFIIGIKNSDKRDKALKAKISASSILTKIGNNNPPTIVLPLDTNCLQMISFGKGKIEYIEWLCTIEKDTELSYEIYSCSQKGRYIPDTKRFEGKVFVKKGNKKWIKLPINIQWEDDKFGYVVILANPLIKIHASIGSVVGMLSMEKNKTPESPFNSWARIEHWTFWADEKTLATYCVRVKQTGSPFSSQKLVDGIQRPIDGPHMWVSAFSNFSKPEWVELAWNVPVDISEIRLFFNSNLQRRLWYGTPNLALRSIPELISDYRIDVNENGIWRTILRITDNKKRKCVHKVKDVETNKLRIFLEKTYGSNYVQLFEIRIY